MNGSGLNGDGWDEAVQQLINGLGVEKRRMGLWLNDYGGEGGRRRSMKNREERGL